MIRFAFKHMLVRKVKLVLVALSIIVSAGVALLAYNVSAQVREGIVNTAAYYDMIIGPSGSATQLAMNTMFFTDTPLGTIPYSLVEELRADDNINQVIPFTMGDSFNGARIVGAEPEFLTGKALASGNMFALPFEAVLGADVAEKYGLKHGDSIVTSHGLAEAGTAHASSPLTVTGILAKTHTAYDGAVFTSYKTVWQTHGMDDHDHEDDHEDEDHSHEDDDHSHEDDDHAEAGTASDAPMSHIAGIDAHDGEDEDDAHEHAGEGTVCAILVKTKSPTAYMKLSQHYAGDASLLVINPSTVLREVLDNVDLSTRIVYALCAVILMMNMLVISVVTLLNMYDAKKEIALMRLIGISMNKIQLVFLIQNTLMGLVSTLLALGASMLFMRFMGGFVASMGIVLNATRVYAQEGLIMLLVFAVSVLPTLICTRTMARKDGISG